MLIPAIDLMGGKIVQLIQGQRKALEFDDFEEWIVRFSPYPLIQLIDLDAAIGTGDNRELVREFARRLPCQVGGGMRSVEAVRRMLDAGAQRVIVGSSLIAKGAAGNDQPNVEFASTLADSVGSERVVCAIDAEFGKVAIRGWRASTTITPLEMIAALELYCGAFLYTHIDSEGLMQGIPLEAVRPLRAATARQLIVAGGIATSAQIDELDAMQVDAVVGMAVYTGRIKLKTGGRVHD